MTPSTVELVVILLASCQKLQGDDHNDPQFAVRAVICDLGMPMAKDVSRSPSPIAKVCAY